jgi:hypothetical protein
MFQFAVVYSLRCFLDELQSFDMKQQHNEWVENVRLTAAHRPPFAGRCSPEQLRSQQWKKRRNEGPRMIVRVREHPGRSSHESSRAEQHPFRDEDRGRSSDSRAFGLTSSRFLLQPLPEP